MRSRIVGIGRSARYACGQFPHPFLHYVNSVAKQFSPKLSPFIVSLIAPALFGMAHVAVATTSVSTPDKTTQDVLDNAFAGRSQNLIVEFDAKGIRRDAEALRMRRALNRSDPQIIKYRARRFASEKLAVYSRLDPRNASVIIPYSHLPLDFVRVRTKQALDKLLADPNVVHVYEDRVEHRALAKSLPLIGEPRAAAVGDLGAGTAVAVLDQRVDYTQSDFGSCTAPGVPATCRVLVDQDAPQLKYDGMGYQDGHGTNVAAIVAGVAPGTKIIALNVFYGESANDSVILAAMNWVIAHRDIYNIVAINLSLGSGKYTSPVTSSPYSSAVVSAYDAGIITVAAAGNDGYINALRAPGAVTGVVSVGAVYDAAFGPYSWQDPPTAPCTDSGTAVDQIACFSNSASFLTLLAPGCAVAAGGTSFCGTSQAAPHVAGAVAVLRSAYPSDSLATTIARLTNGGVPITDPRNGIVKPRLNLPQALSLPPCTYSLAPANASFGADSGSGTISLTASPGCTWTGVSDVKWISITAGATGIGNGSLSYALDPNGNASSRIGTITVAGQDVTITQAGNSKAPASVNVVWLLGTYGYATQGLSSVTLTVSGIANYSWRTTGTLRIELWLFSAPYALGRSGWKIASYQLWGTSNGQLGPLQQYSNVSATVPISGLPAPGAYYPVIIISEYYGYGFSCPMSDGFCVDTYGSFDRMFYIADTQAPTVPTGLYGVARSSTQIDLRWTASTDNVGVTAYKIYSNGALLGRNNVNAVSVSGNSPGTNYSFSVAACDVAGNCSGQSIPASVTTPVATNNLTTSQSDCLFNWAADTYPALFEPARPISLTQAPYYFRYYSGTNAYLGTSSADQHLYYLGPASSGQLLDLNLVATWLATAGCQ